MPRIFIAIPIPNKIKQRISQEILSDKTFSNLRIRWVQPKNLHITLKFLGETPSERIPALIAAMQATAAQTDPFSIRLEKGGVFPNRQKPKVVWIDIEPPAPLLKIWQTLETNAAKNGFPRDTKPLKAHLTLGRIADSHVETEKTRIGPLLDAASTLQLPIFEVNQIQLIQSTLSPQGAEYSLLHQEVIGLQA